MRIRINTEMFHVKRAYEHDGGSVATITTEEGPEFIVAEDTEEAGKAAREYWADMAANDPAEFACMVGEETLVCWGLGTFAGPGTTKVKSLSEWLDLWLATPEEHFASYDGNACEVRRVGKLVEEIGFVPSVAYRSN